MCSPVALMTANMGVQGAAAYGQASMQRSLLGAKQDFANEQADDAIHRGEKTVQDHRRRSSHLQATQRATMASNNVRLTEGSPLAVLMDTDVMAEMDAEVIRQNADRESRGHRMQASMFGAAKSATNPMLAGVSSLLGNSGTVASKWYDRKAKDSFNG